MSDKKTNLQIVEKQTSYWRYAAWTTPFTALALILSINLFGLQDYIKIVSIGIISIFVSVSVFWWWWALDKIITVVGFLDILEKRFGELKEELSKTSKEIRK